MRSFEARFISLFGGLLVVVACSGKSESTTQAGGQAPLAGAKSNQAGSPSGGGGASAGLSLAGVGSLAGSAGVAGEAIGGSFPDPCGGDPGPAAGTGVIGGTYGSGGEGGAQTVYLDCSAYARCGVYDTSCPAGTSCTSISGCESPVCAGELCDACPGECKYLLILPSQIECEGAQYVGIEPHLLPIPCN